MFAGNVYHREDATITEGKVMSDCVLYGEPVVKVKGGFKRGFKGQTIYGIAVLPEGAEEKFIADKGDTIEVLTNGALYTGGCFRHSSIGDAAILFDRTIDTIDLLGPVETSNMVWIEDEKLSRDKLHPLALLKGVKNA